MATQPSTLCHMLAVKIIMNSRMEELLGFKCCGLPNQNLEMHVRNMGEQPVTVAGRFSLENETETLNCTHLFPPWEQTIPPGDATAYYCSMEEAIWNRYQTLTLSDKEGRTYRFSTKEITCSG